MQFNKSKRKERVGWYFYDFANSAFPTTVITLFLGPYLTSVCKNAADAQGMINFLGFNIAAGAYYPFIVSISVILQALALPLLGALADYTNRKKFLLLLFAYIGALSTSGLFFLQGTNYKLGGLLFIIANICFGASVVMYNSFLNDIAEPENADSVSSLGWAWGYIGGGTLLALNLYFFVNAENFGIAKDLAVRICLSSAGVWWALFTLLPAFSLKVRQNAKRIPKGERYVSIGFKQLKETMKDAKNYPITIKFLIAYLFYNDGVQAVIALAAQFGQEELGLKMSVLTTVILIVQFVAFFGSIIFNYIAKKTDTKTALLIGIIGWIFTIFYAYFLLYTEFDFYILGVGVAIVLGGTQALSRSMYSKLIPVGKEAEYFSLYELSERGTSWLAPAIFGLTYQYTHSYRSAIFSLIAFFIIGFILLLRTKFNFVPNAEKVV